MRREPDRILSASLAAALALSAGVALGQSYGEASQTLVLDALDFQDETVDEGFVGADGYMYNMAPDVHSFLAPLNLPSGAEIELVCIDYYDPSSIPVVDVYLEEIKLIPGGEGPQVSVVPHAYTTSVLAGYGSICTDPLSFTFRTAKDVDDDGDLDSVAYAARVGLFTGSAVGAVRVTWTRQVSPPPDAPTFADVPANDGTFPDIEALAASGITSGCGGGNFCPNQPVTRGEMAKFLATALGLHWPY